MAFKERIQILTTAEQSDLYDPPILSVNDQRFIFTINDKERDECLKFRSRHMRCMFVVLLGYFRIKPVVINPGYHQIKQDIQYVAQTVLPGAGLKPFNLTPKENERIYQRIFQPREYQRFRTRPHSEMLFEYLQQQYQLWAFPRYLFDSATEYLSNHQIAIPAYSTLQKIISQVVTQEHGKLINRVNQSMSQDLQRTLSDMVNHEGALTLQQLRQSAKSFYATELGKELAVHHHLKPWMSEANTALESLEISPKNHQHFAERVDYYGAKLKRLTRGSQQLYLLCYLRNRWQQALERIADGLVYHIRQHKQKAKAYAQEVVYRDWKKAAKNVSKAAEVLHLFIDDSVDQHRPFGEIKQKALKLLAANDLESVCLFLNEQKRSEDEAMWQYYDQHNNACTGFLRELFLCLHFEGSEGTQRLTSALYEARKELLRSGALTISAMDRQLPIKKQRPFIIQEDGSIQPDRYEWYLYLQIPERLKGQLTLPEIIKYRALDDDLVNIKRWRRDKKQLIEQSQLPKLKEKPERIIEEMALELDNRLHAVSDYLEQADNRNIILYSPKGKRVWRLPTTSKKYIVNNPFFQQMPTTSIADVLRIVDRDTDFIDCFEHVLGMQSQSRHYEYDLLAILVGNATGQGIYGIAQISDRTYDQLSTIQANYLRLETLREANDCINNATARLPIFKHYNIQEDIIHASADGQKFEARRETFKTRYSSKYFGSQKGVSAISLIANHAAIYGDVISANDHESHYIQDLLLNNSSEIEPHVLSTDTHGVNHVNFALLDLFGYQFAPRYARVSKVINEMFNVTENQDGHVQLSLKKPINSKCVIQQWDTIQRIIISLKERQTTQATLVRKLSGYKSNHPLLEALTEYNRMVKASYLLNYIDDASLRNHVQRALNRGEAYHQLRRALSNVSGDQFRGSSDEEILLWNECARLVTNAIIYFNSCVLSRLLTSFEHQQDEDKIAIVKQASPVAWFNINLKGTYEFEVSEKLPDLEEMMLSIEGYLPVDEE